MTFLICSQLPSNDNPDPTITIRVFDPVGFAADLLEKLGQRKEAISTLLTFQLLK
jgi:hypothetical protein